MAIPDQVNKAFINNLNEAIVQTYGEVTANSVLRFSLTYCINQRINGDSIEATIAPFQRIFPVYPINDWSTAVMFITHVIWVLLKIKVQNTNTST